MFLLQYPFTIHAIPGTNYVLILGEQSLNSYQQSQYVDTITSHLCKQNKTTSNSHSKSNTNNPLEANATCATSITSSLGNNIAQKKYYFVADAYIIQYVTDTAANHIILNDVHYITYIVSTSNKIKGIGGNCVRVVGTGKLRLPLKSDNCRTSIVSNLDSIYVPRSPYN